VQQQLKIHIEVLNETIQDLTREKDQMKGKMVVEFKELEAKRTHKFKLIVEKRQEMILSIQKQLGDSTKKT
jgi:hypothetical protein